MEGHNCEDNIKELNRNIIMSLKEEAKKFKARNHEKTIKFSEETKNFRKKRRYIKPPTIANKKTQAAEPNKTIQKSSEKSLSNNRNHVRKKKQSTGFKMVKKNSAQENCISQECLKITVHSHLNAIV